MLLLAAEGLTDKEIAKHLNLSQRTIGTYWERMRQKLGPFSRTQLVARFLRYENELERSSESYRDLFSTWDEGVWILGAGGKTIYANQPVATLLGKSSQTLMGSDAKRLLADVAGNEIEGFLSRAAEDPQTAEIKLSREDGSPRWLRMRASPITDRRGEVSSLVLIVQDVTFHNHVKHTLTSCEESLEFLANRSSDLVARFDDELYCVFANASFSLVGVEPKLCEGRTIPEMAKILKPAEIWAAKLEEALSSGSGCSFESEWSNYGTLTTHCLPEPSMDFRPRHVLCITPLPR